LNQCRGISLQNLTNNVTICNIINATGITPYPSFILNVGINVMNNTLGEIRLNTISSIDHGIIINGPFVGPNTVFVGDNQLVSLRFGIEVLGSTVIGIQNQTRNIWVGTGWVTQLTSNTASSFLVPFASGALTPTLIGTGVVYVPYVFPSKKHTCSVVSNKNNEEELEDDVTEEIEMVDHELIAESNTSLYPNPAHSEINFILPQSIENNTITIIDLQGNIVKRIISSDQVVQINIQDLASGTYIAIFSDGINMRKEKFIKE
jgi:hypothetical protein